MVKEFPDKFNEWVKENQERIESAKSLPYFIRDNKERIDEILKNTTKGELYSVIETIKEKGNIKYLEVARLKEPLTQEQIISRIGGGDETVGSCSSLAFAYAANKGGLDVLDFRGGESLSFFSSDKNICTIMKKVGGYYGYGEKSGMELLKKYAKIGKEYYLGIGRHVAIVRKVAENKFEYLELQSETRNGWHNLNVRVLRDRFDAKGRSSWGEMVEISKLYKDRSFKELMGYINTKADEQLKGSGGSIK